MEPKMNADMTKVGTWIEAISWLEMKVDALVKDYPEMMFVATVEKVEEGFYLPSVLWSPHTFEKVLDMLEEDQKQGELFEREKSKKRKKS